VLSVSQIYESRIQSHLQTGKRLGFGFRTDDVHGEKAYTGK
jgi:hypothetical protein